MNGKSPSPTSSLRFALLILALLIGTGAAHANADNKAAAIDIAMEQNGPGGKVIGVKEKSGDDGSAWFEIKILTDGKVRIFKIDKS